MSGDENAVERMVSDLTQLPSSHRDVIAECIAEAWRNLEQGDALTSGDVAADIAQRLVNEYDVTTYNERAVSAAPYTLHYTSGDGPGPDATWSVYREQYAHRDDDHPIDGSSEWVSSHPSQDAADAEANRLQRLLSQDT